MRFDFIINHNDCIERAKIIKMKGWWWGDQIYIITDVLILAWLGWRIGWFWVNSAKREREREIERAIEWVSKVAAEIFLDLEHSCCTAFPYRIHTSSSVRESRNKNRGTHHPIFSTINSLTIRYSSSREDNASNAGERERACVCMYELATKYIKK